MNNVQKNKICELKNLWKETFFDNDEYLNNFFKYVYDEKNTLIYKCKNKIVSALYMIPYTFQINGKRHKIMYLYALATDEKYRKNGIMTEMINESNRFIEKEGCIGSFLIPANENLYTFYHKFGYSNYLYEKKYSLIKQSDIDYKLIECDNYDKIFEIDDLNYLNGKILLNRELNNFFCKTFIDECGKIYLCLQGEKEVGYIFAKNSNGKLNIYDTNLDDLCAYKKNKKGLFRKNTLLLNDENFIEDFCISKILE